MRGVHVEHIVCGSVDMCVSETGCVSLWAGCVGGDWSCVGMCFGERKVFVCVGVCGYRVD